MIFLKQVVFENALKKYILMFSFLTSTQEPRMSLLHRSGKRKYLKKTRTFVDVTTPLYITLLHLPEHQHICCPMKTRLALH